MSVDRYPFDARATAEYFGDASPAATPPPNGKARVRRTEAGPGKEPDEERPSAGDGPRPYIEPAPVFLSREDPEVGYVLPELLPAQTLTLLHGEPRTRKSWAALELAIAVAVGGAAFGLERFRAASAQPVLYSSQEDDARRVRERARRFLRGRDVAAPEHLAFSVHAGIDLEDAVWQETLIVDVRTHGFRLVVFDPIRRYSANVDKGPAEVRMVTAFLRRLAVEAGCTVLVVHHDVKPAREKEDTRRRGHRASGADWFAACECPIALEPAGKGRTLVVPEDFKFGADPKAFTFRLREDQERTWVRLESEDVEAHQVEDVALHEKIIEFLRHSPGAPGNAIVKGVRGQRDKILDALKTLERAGRLDSVERTGKGGKRVEWMVAAEDPAS